MKSRTFVDTVTVHAEAGSGGNGCVSFRREKFVPHGGPSGGDGGRGGHVILLGDHDTTSLIHLYYAPHQRADSGGHGRGKEQYGRNGHDRVIKVPRGTEVWDESGTVMLADIVQHGQEHLIAKGGRGGWGNIHWKSATHQTPMEHTDGEPGEHITLLLKLKLLADIGLVGFPNAGKSSLLRRISDAHPKVAPYPFTTLNPIIGTMIFDDYSRLTVADIPGLIEGAHNGVGLGHDFLRHVERSCALVHVVDMAAEDGRDPVHDYQCVRQELELYTAELLSRPSVVVANKMDLPAAADNLARFRRETGTTPIEFSAETGAGLPELRDALYRLGEPARLRSLAT